MAVEITGSDHLHYVTCCANPDGVRLEITNGRAQHGGHGFDWNASAG